MKAVRLSEYGGQLVFDNVPTPTIAQVVGRRQNSWRAFLQHIQVLRWPNIEFAYLS